MLRNNVLNTALWSLRSDRHINLNKSRIVPSAAFCDPFPKPHKASVSRRPPCWPPTKCLNTLKVIVPSHPCCRQHAQLYTAVTLTAMLYSIYIACCHKEAYEVDVYANCNVNNKDDGSHNVVQPGAPGCSREIKDSFESALTPSTQRMCFKV